MKNYWAVLLICWKLNRKEISCELFALMNEAEAAQQTNADSNDENSENKMNERSSVCFNEVTLSSVGPGLKFLKKTKIFSMIMLLMYWKPVLDI